MTILVNDEVRDLAPDTTVRDLVADLTGREVTADGRSTDGTGLGVAIALDGEVLPRSEWAATPLADGARVEVVTATQGG